MADLTELVMRIQAAVPGEEYAKLHPEFDDRAYSNAAEHAAQVLLQVAGRDPEVFKSALDAFRQNPFDGTIDSLLTKDERALVLEGRYGLTGFQWGWAVNAVAHLLEQDVVPNPALWTFSD